MGCVFLVVKKRLFTCLFICIFLGVCLGLFFSNKETFIPARALSIVIDAGHGGQDGGAIGRNTKITESELNLQYALELKKICEEFNINVVLTRKDMNGLYSPMASNKKKSEMEKRKEIIDNSNADVVISIHMNSFPVKSSRGAQAFYKDGFEPGKSFAEAVQQSLKKSIKNARNSSKAGDYFVLNCTDKPAILVECGFLSNTEEELLLCQEGYRKELCSAIFRGVLDFLTF